MMDKKCSECEIVRLPDGLKRGYWKNGEWCYRWECNECRNETILSRQPDVFRAEKLKKIVSKYVKQKLDERVCPLCQDWFMPKNAHHQYCSVECRKAFYERETRRAGRFIILERDQFRCVYCGKSSIEDASGLHVDHIIPRKLNGSSVAANLVTACSQCNGCKSAKVMATQVYTRLYDEIAQRNVDAGIDPQLVIRLNSPQSPS